MTEPQVPPCVAQRVIVNFFTKEGIKPSKICTRLKAQKEDDTLSKTHMLCWPRILGIQREIVTKTSHIPRLTIQEIVLKGVSIWNFATAQTIITSNLDSNNICFCEVSKLLTEDRKKREKVH